MGKGVLVCVSFVLFILGICFGINSIYYTTEESPQYISSVLYLGELENISDAFLGRHPEWRILSVAGISDEMTRIDHFLQRHPRWYVEIAEEPLSLMEMRLRGWRLIRHDEIDGNLFAKMDEIQNGACNASNDEIQYFYDSGFGSTAHIMIRGLRRVLYRESSATFHFVPFRLNPWYLANASNCSAYGYNWSCYFIPQSKCAFPYDLQNWSSIPAESTEKASYHSMPRLDEETRYYKSHPYIPLLNIGIPVPLAGKCATCSDSGFDFALRRYATRPRAFMRRATREWLDRIAEKNFSLPCATLHVRRTDITFYNEGRWYCNVSAYMREATPYLKRLGIRTILLMTDSHSAIIEATTQFPEYHWVYLERPRWRDDKKLAHDISIEIFKNGTTTHVPSGNGLQEMLAMMVEFELTRHSSLWIGGTRSNYGDLLYMYSCYKPGNEWQCPPTIRIQNQENTRRFV